MTYLYLFTVIIDYYHELSSEGSLYDMYFSGLIRHLHISHNTPCFLPKFFITFVCNFFCVFRWSQEKLKTMLLQNCGLGNKVHYGRRANGELITSASSVGIQFEGSCVLTFCIVFKPITPLEQFVTPCRRIIFWLLMRGTSEKGCLI